MTHYEVLGVTKDATQDDIKKAYRKKSKELHPDVNPDAKATEEFKKVAEAFEVLGDPEKRRRYDSGGFNPFGDMFEFFNHSPGFNRLRVDVTITFLESVFGCDKELEFDVLTVCKTCTGNGSKDGKSLVSCDMCKGYGMVSKQQGFVTMQTTCPKCHGSRFSVLEKCDDCHGLGTKSVKEKHNIHIPSHIRDHSSVIMRGIGNEFNNGMRGDVQCVVHVQPHQLFYISHINNSPIYVCDIPLFYRQLVLGDTVEIPTLDGKEVLIISAGTQSGKLLKVKNYKGIPYFIKTVIIIPENVTNEYKEQLLNMNESNNESNLLNNFRNLVDGHLNECNS